MKKILYVGGFEMPDKNAAAQRVLSIAKALRDVGYEISFYGITKSRDYKGNVDGFYYEAYPYPSGLFAWFKYAIGVGIIAYIKRKKPDYIFLYNYPSFAQERILAYCKKNNIKTIGDITEWYRSASISKSIDTSLRMYFSNKHLNGIISISKYLTEFYKGKTIIQIPPLVDKKEKKWQIQPMKRQDDKIHLVYIGTGSIKDRLDKIIKGIKLSGDDKFYLDVIGITKKQFVEIYHLQPESTKMSIIFHGRLPHQDALKYLISADFQIFFRDFIRVNNAGFPTKFVESMSAGIPVITNRISNIDDYVKNGDNSFMIEHPDEREICEILKRISDLSKEEIDAIKKRCLKDVFDYRNYLEQLKDFMDSI